MRIPQTFITKNKLNIIVLAWLIAHILFSGHLWIWNLFSVLPSAFFLLPFLLLVVWSLLRRNKSGVLFLVLLMPLVWMQTDINLPGKKMASQGTIITVFNWNTGTWYENEDKEKFYQFLKDQKADVYHLQEHADKRFYPLNDIREIQSYFPGYTVIAKGEFVTLTKYPVVRTFPVQAGDFMRVDMIIDGRPISFYNVHMSLQLNPSLVTKPLRLLSDVRTRFYRRQTQFRLLRVALEENSHDIYMSGDFNTTIPMGNMRPLLRKYQDSYRLSDTFFPRTWTINGMKLWRIDYNLLGVNLQPVSHEDIGVGDGSDHSAQKITFVL